MRVSVAAQTRSILLLSACGVLVVAALITGSSSRPSARERTSLQPTASNAAPTTETRLSLADRQVRTGRAMIARLPADVRGYNLLCAAYMQKTRETGDFGFNARAEAALKRSLEIEPDNFDAIKLQAMLLLSSHRFSEALEVARHAQQLRPQDHEVYAAVTDALVELGRYDEASDAAQRMINLRPDTASYARVSYLRALHGDAAGAIAAMQLAVQAASPQDPEGVAWCRVHLGYELMNGGRLADAERQFDLALLAFADYHLALAAKARARLSAGDLSGAAHWFERAQNRVPSPDTVAVLGDVYSVLGRHDDAQRQYDLLEFIERAGAPGVGTYSRQLALFWADHAMRLDDALAIARQERVARADIFTDDTLAWCLYKTGQLAEAKTSIHQALRLGTRDGRIYYHAGMIHKGLGDREGAVKYMILALETNPWFDPLQADVARRTLAELGARPRGGQ